MFEGEPLVGVRYSTSQNASRAVAKIIVDNSLLNSSVRRSSSLVNGSFVTLNTDEGGETDENGEIIFKHGKTYYFYAGPILLGSIKGEDIHPDRTILITDLANVDRTDINDEKAVKVAFYLHNVINVRDNSINQDLVDSIHERSPPTTSIATLTAEQLQDLLIETLNIIEFTFETVRDKMAAINTNADLEAKATASDYMPRIGDRIILSASNSIGTSHGFSQYEWVNRDTGEIIGVGSTQDIVYTVTTQGTLIIKLTITSGEQIATDLVLITVGDDTTDSDGDGLSDSRELHIYHTNPRDYDTDGDGKSDGEEVYSYNPFNILNTSPLIANLPKLGLEIVTTADIGFDTTTSTEGSEEISIVDGTSVAESTGYVTSSGRSSSIEHGWSITSGVEVEIGVESGVTFLFEAGISGTYGSEQSYEFSVENSQERSSSYERALTESKTKGSTVDGASMGFGIKLLNYGSEAFNIDDIIIQAYTLDTNLGVEKSFGRMEFGAGFEEPNIVLYPGEETGLLGVEVDLSLDDAKALLLNPNLITVGIASTALTSGGTDYTSIYTNVNRKTALININFSADKFITFQIATQTKYNAGHTSYNNLYNKLNLGEVLNLAGITFNGKSTHTDEDYKEKLTSIDGYINDNVNDTKKWFIIITHSTTPDMHDVYGAKTPLEDIIVVNGDTIDIVYSIDEDKDKLPLTIEKIYGSDDKLKDTDGDGLTDYQEIKGWTKTVTITDNDINIEQIVTYRTNPNTDDTDFDGWSDPIDVNPVVPELSDNRGLEAIDIIFSNGDKHNIASSSSLSGNENIALSLAGVNVPVGFIGFSFKEDPAKPIANIKIYKEIGGEYRFVSQTSRQNRTSNIHITDHSGEDLTAINKAIYFGETRVGEKRNFRAVVEAIDGSVRNITITVTSQGVDTSGIADLSFNNRGLNTNNQLRTRISYNGELPPGAEHMVVIKAPNALVYRHDLTDEEELKVGDVLYNGRVIAKISRETSSIGVDIIDTHTKFNTSFNYALYIRVNDGYKYIKTNYYNTPRPDSISYSLDLTRITSINSNDYGGEAEYYVNVFESYGGRVILNGIGRDDDFVLENEGGYVESEEPDSWPTIEYNGLTDLVLSSGIIHFNTLQIKAIEYDGYWSGGTQSIIPGATLSVDSTDFSIQGVRDFSYQGGNENGILKLDFRVRWKANFLN